MDVRELVKDHYGGGQLSDAILTALGEAGTDIDHLAAADLFPVDQLHAGGAQTTKHVLGRLDVGPGVRLLDVGCGLGGGSRMAAMSGAEVTGIDLTPDFVEAATELSVRVGLDDRTTFLATAGESLPLEADVFDAAFMIHVGMNIPDKSTAFAEINRVLKPGGRFAVFEQMRTGDDDLTYPMPWAEDERSSFLETQEDYRVHLEAAGFDVEAVEDLTPLTMGAPPTGALSPVVVFGPVFAQRIGNNVAATRAGQLGAILVVARA
jgi:ubiquinone/menaquinone biosynthesis C-methylase UbiE